MRSDEYHPASLSISGSPGYSEKIMSHSGFSAAADIES